MPRKFRKVYFIAEDNQLFRNNYSFVKVFREEAHAKEQEAHLNKRALQEMQMESNKNQPMTKYKAEGFYLVHESLFDEILKKHTED